MSVNYQQECLCSGQILCDEEGCGNMPQSEHGLWEEKDPFFASLWQTSYSHARVTWRGRSCPTLYHWMGKAETHQLMAANNGKLPMSMYVELDLDFFGIMVPNVEVLITQESNELLDECHKTNCQVSLVGIW